MGIITPEKAVAGHVPTASTQNSTFGNATSTGVEVRGCRRRVPLRPLTSHLSLHLSTCPGISSSSPTDTVTPASAALGPALAASPTQILYPSETTTSAALGPVPAASPTQILYTSETTHSAASSPAPSAAPTRNLRRSDTTIDTKMFFCDAAWHVIAIVSTSVLFLALWFHTGFAAPTQPLEGVEQSLADMAKATLPISNQEVLWFAVASLLAMGMVMLGREIGREWGIEKQERQEKRADEKEERREKRADEKEERREKRADEKEERREKRADEKEERKEKRAHEILTLDRKERYKLEKKRLKIQELELQIQLEELKQARQNASRATTEPTPGSLVTQTFVEDQGSFRIRARGHLRESTHSAEGGIRTQSKANRSSKRFHPGPKYTTQPGTPKASPPTRTLGSGRIEAPSARPPYGGRLPRHFRLPPPPPTAERAIGYFVVWEVLDRPIWRSEKEEEEWDAVAAFFSYVHCSLAGH
ncbi:hypothetical protein EV426DRAFT_701412 [Tirmania nivea]|nr:hypothetical protein EV426DRAFT_701412 [Tirmania nivea]